MTTRKKQAEPKADTAAQETTDQAAPREYKSIILTVDHTSTRKDDHVVQKMVKSTETLNETMLSLFGYYQEKHLLHSASTLEMFQEAGKSVMPCFIYRTPENVQIVMAEVTYAALISRKGTLLEAEDFIVNAAGEMLKMAQDQRGDAVPLMLFSFTTSQEG